MARKPYIPLAVRLTAVETENQWLKDINWHLSEMVTSVGRNAELVTHDRRQFGAMRYPYIPFDHTLFLRALIALRWKLHHEGYGKPYTKETPRPRFIDVGCGIGDKLLLAHQLACEAYGIEADPYLIRYAKRVLGVTDSETLAREQMIPLIVQGDALRVIYDSYQIIYLDAPFQDKKVEARLERRIYSQAALGAFIVTPHCQTMPPREDYAQGKNFGNKPLLVFRRVHKAGKRFVTA
jgi:SAM-dependent methyltransferase